MAIIKSGASTDALTIDATSNACRFILYDNLGNYRGPKATYRAAVTNTVAAAASTSPFFILEGSSTKTIIVQRITLTGRTITSVSYTGTYVVLKYSTAISGGTPTTLTKVPLDSNSAASTANTCQVYTAAPTAGTLVGTIACRRIINQATTAAAAGIPGLVDIDFRIKGSENTGVYLRGTSEGLGVAFGASPASTTTLAIEVEWTEE